MIKGVVEEKAPDDFLSLSLAEKQANRRNKDIHTNCHSQKLDLFKLNNK